MSDILVIGARGIPGVEGGAEKHAEYVFSRFAANGYEVTAAIRAGSHSRLAPTIFCGR